MSYTGLRKEFITNRQGKDFVLYAGLLDMAHAKGLISIITELIQAPTAENKETAIVFATARFAPSEDYPYERVFTGIGDANAGNVGKMIAMHCTRMAETRSKARALRDALNIGVTALEELADDKQQADPDPTISEDQLIKIRRGLAKLNRPEPTGLTGFSHTAAQVLLHELVQQFKQQEAQQPTNAAPSTSSATVRTQMLDNVVVTDDGKWVDKGTGEVLMSTAQHKEIHALLTELGLPIEIPSYMTSAAATQRIVELREQVTAKQTEKNIAALQAAQNGNTATRKKATVR